MIGQTVGKYRIVDRLGRGGMGTVYKAVDETLDREVAIEVLNPDLNDSDVLKRFRAEAVTLARLNHQGIATLYELHRHEDELLMVMEFVRGETFHDLSERLGPLPPAQAAHLCMQILDALAHAHRAGVVHRDLKPANVMVTENGVVKVMDFGIARVLGTEHFTHGGYMMGTPAYMAPEQVLGRDLDGRADLYAVGVVLYRLLTAQLPFDADTAIAMVQKQISDAPTPVATFRPDLPAWCTSVIDRALQKEPGDRFQTAEEFRYALMAAAQPQTLGELPTIATPTPPGLPRDSDMTLAHESSWSRSTMASRGRTPTSSSAVATPPSQSITAQAPPVSAPESGSLERTTATTVVLGRTHLVAIAALFVVLAAGIGVLGFAALRRGSFQQQLPLLGAQPQLSTDAAAVTPPASDASSQPVPDTSTQPTNGTGVAATAGAGAAQPAGAVPTPPLVSRTSVQRTATNTADADAAKPTDVAPASSDAASPPVPPVKAEAGAVRSFEDIRVLVPDGGDKARERQGVLQLGGGRLTIVDRAGGAAIVSLPYSAIAGVFYSRSKQPRWRDADGKEIESKVDLGRMGFFRGDRNWLILLTKSDPLIIRLDDGDLKDVLPAVQEQTGVMIRR